jgi:hypothetical protein
MTQFLHAIVAIVAPFLMPVTVEATGYTCEAITGNPMNVPGMCIALANGSEEVMSPGMACPRAWMGMGFYVPREGMLYCDDTGAHAFLFTAKGVLRPHTDMRFSTLSAAWSWGKQTIVIYRIRPPRKEVSYAPRPALFGRFYRPCSCHDLRGNPYTPPAGWHGRSPCPALS